VGELRERLLGRASAGGGAAARIRSLAVLPLENLSSDPEQEYFADGMTDEIITNLAQIDTLRVISRSSVLRYKHSRKSLPEMAKELNVDAVVEGTVMRSGNRVRITAQLIRAANEQHLWADQFERDLRDLLSLQADVARAIATRIQLQLTTQQQVRLSAGRQVNPEAYDYYLKGRYNFSERSGKEAFDNAIRYFEMAIEKDPGYAPAYAGLVHCYSWGIFEGLELAPREAWSKAAAAGKRALELDDQLGEAHIAMAEVRFRFDWDWPEAEREYKRGLELSPNDAVGHEAYSAFLGIMGWLDEALAEATRARELDPLSPQAAASVGYVYGWSRRYDEAIAEFRRTLQLDPNFIMAQSSLASSYDEKGMYAEAVSEELKLHALKGGSSEEIESLRNAFVASGIRGFWEKRLEWEKRQLNQPRPPYTQLARLCVHLGRTDEAFHWLDKAYEARYAQMPNMGIAPWLDPIRSDPRYADLMRRIGLPQ
jgi:TolB-like protein/Tfp pilus assembly protein PilF